jgi:hypothetical protein
MSFIFRPHRWLLAESMAEVQEFESREALAEHLRRGPYPGELVSIEKYGRDLDTRLDPPWDTHIVMATWTARYRDGRVTVTTSPAGFTNGPVP